MNILQTNFDKFRQGDFAIVFEALERAFCKFDIAFYLIGAQARDIWVGHLEIRELRATTDIDFAIYIETSGQFQELTEHLCTVEGFQNKPREPYRFIFGTATIDILPFGTIEQNRSVYLGHPPIEISVCGMREVTEQAEAIDDVWKIVTLPGLVVLKLIAFSEKPEREKDIRDIALVLRHYHDVAPGLIWEPAYSDLLTESLDPVLVSARILGRQIGQLLSRYTELYEQVISVLRRRLQGYSEQDINDRYTYRDRDQSYSETILLKLLLDCMQGIQDIGN